MTDSQESERQTSLPDDAMLEFLSDLAAEPYRHGFNATLRRLECGATDSPRLGQSVRPSEDCVRLGQEPTLAFAPAQLASYGHVGKSKVPRLEVFGPGLFGPNGALPIHLTEYVRERMMSKMDPTMWRFVDIFHHRMLSLLYRAWANTEPVVSADRRNDDRFANYVASLIGLGLDSLRERDAFPDHARLHYAGHFARQTRSPEGLVGVIEDFFSVKAQLQEFVGEWLSIPEISRWRLGEMRRDAGLGLGTTIGGSVWGCQHKFRIIIGPVDFATLNSFLPGSETSNRLVGMVRSFCGDEFDWDVQLILKKEEVPALQLGNQGLLGRTSWFNNEQRTADVSDTRLHPLSGIGRAKAA